jgi:hypothetical protein
MKVVFTVARRDGGITDIVIIPDTQPSSIKREADGLRVEFPDTFTIYDRCREGTTGPGETIHEHGLSLKEAIDSAHSLALMLHEN